MKLHSHKRSKRSHKRSKRSHKRSHKRSNKRSKRSKRSRIHKYDGADMSEIMEKFRVAAKEAGESVYVFAKSIINTTNKHKKEIIAGAVLVLFGITACYYYLESKDKDKALIDIQNKYSLKKVQEALEDVEIGKRIKKYQENLYKHRYNKELERRKQHRGIFNRAYEYI